MLETSLSEPGGIVAHSRVRAMYDPSKRGVTTGQIRRRFDAIYVEILFDSGEVDWEDSRHLEPVPERETRRMAFERLRFFRSQSAPRRSIGREGAWRVDRRPLCDGIGQRRVPPAPVQAGDAICTLGARPYVDCR